MVKGGGLFKNRGCVDEFLSPELISLLMTDEEFAAIQKRLASEDLTEKEFRDIVLRLGADVVERNRAAFDALM